MAKAKKKSIYGVHPGVQMMVEWREKLPAKTGKTLEQWIALVKRDGPADEKALRVWLKEKHGFGTNWAWWIAEHSVGKGGTWDFDALNKFITNPKAAVPGTAMGFAGIPKDSERADVIAYLNSLSDSPKPLPTAAK